MDILNFFNRQLEVDESFKTKGITVLVTSYASHMKSLIQNILFRLENTGFENNIIISENPTNTKDVSDFVKEFSGFFNTEIYIAQDKNYPFEYIKDTIIVLNDYYILNNKLNYKDKNLEKLLSNIELKPETNILSLSSGYENTSAFILLNNVKYNNLKKTIYLDNMYYTDMLNSTDFDFELYPMVESKLFNIFNQIITPNLKVFQTFEIIDLISMTSKLKFQFKDISRQDKFFNKEYPFNLDDKLIESEYHLFDLLDCEYSEDLAVSNELVKFLQIFITQYEHELKAEDEILKGRYETFNQLNSVTNDKFNRQLSALKEKIDDKMLRISALQELSKVDFESIKHKDVVEILNLAKTIKSGR